MGVRVEAQHARDPPGGGEIHGDLRLGSGDDRHLGGHRLVAEPAVRDDLVPTGLQVEHTLAIEHVALCGA